MDLDKLYAILPRVSKPSQYLGNEINVIKKDFDAAKVRVCLIFPDKYEMGMSHVGLKILYEILNRMPDVVCERAFAPDVDLEAELRKENIPFFSLESKRPLIDFDILGFSFTYELTYTNFLNILDLAQIPLRQKNRTHEHPLIIGGGGCMMNAEPIADFLDAAVLGDGEEVIVEIVEIVGATGRINVGATGWSPLQALSQIEGVYVPSFFEPIYNEDGTIQEVKPLKEGYTKIKKRVVSNLDQQVYPTKLLVPTVKIIHDRVGIEIQRGCNRSCRFCQAGYIDRPVRQRSPDTVLNIAQESLKQTGLEQISLLSLSAADYAPLVPLMAELNQRYADQKISISVPATRTEKLTPELIEQIKQVRKTGFTVAPEAGSPRMRRVINKGNKVDDLYRAVDSAFSAGWNLLKLYYMIGLPFELDEDVLGIVHEGNECIKICLRYTSRAELNLSVSSFVPKPHTPFQWEPQMTIEETRSKHDRIKRNLQNRKIRFKYHRPEMSYLEGLLSRGDRRLGELLELVFQEGCRFDEWEEHFDFSKWQRAMQKWGRDPAFYLHRRRSFEEVLPWDHLLAQMNKNWLWDEYQKAHEAALDGLDEEKKLLVHHQIKLRDHRRLKPLFDQLPGFTEDCSVQRCSYCGVCDFKGVKNRIYVVGDQPIMVKKGNREWHGWNPVGARPLESPPHRLGAAGWVDSNDPIIQPSNSCKIRFRYFKRGPARFMGHLELMGVLKRTIKRANLPVSYSQGFHPQMKLSMSHPLSLGIESDWEFFDLELAHFYHLQGIHSILTQMLPHGLTIDSFELIDRKTPSLYALASQMEYQVYFDNNHSPWPLELADKVGEFKKSTSWKWVREGQKGRKEFDLKRLIELKMENWPEFITISILIKPEGSLKPQEILKALFGETQWYGRVRFLKSGISWTSDGLSKPVVDYGKKDLYSLNEL